jgi:hypothetical protein
VACRLAPLILVFWVVLRLINTKSNTKHKNLNVSYTVYGTNSGGLSGSISRGSSTSNSQQTTHNNTSLTAVNIIFMLGVRLGVVGILAREDVKVLTVYVDLSMPYVYWARGEIKMATYSFFVLIQKEKRGMICDSMLSFWMEVNWCRSNPSTLLCL